MFVAQLLHVSVLLVAGEKEILQVVWKAAEGERKDAMVAHSADCVT